MPVIVLTLVERVVPTSAATKIKAEKQVEMKILGSNMVYGFMKYNLIILVLKTLFILK